MNDDFSPKETVQTRKISRGNSGAPASFHTNEIRGLSRGVSMAADYAKIATELSRDLQLSRPPVQISYLEKTPEGVEEHPGGSPSVCTFFAEGQVHPFYANQKAHDACEVGAFVMGIQPAGELGGRLTTTLGMMH